MRSRPLLVVVRRIAGTLDPARAGILAPVAIAVALAVTGYEISAPGDGAALTAPVLAVDGVELPDRGAQRAEQAQLRRSVVREQPAKKKVRRRASRAKARRAVRRPAWVRPSRGPLTSGYGPRWGRMHRGVDFGAPYGSPIYAAASGVVSYAGPEGGYGRLVTIRHAGGVSTAYGHMSRIVVRRGQRVSAGQVVAYVGSAGRSTGPHLHFEVRRGAAYLSPIPFLRARGVAV